ncbi:MAG: CRISPR-associated helicase Cas3' [Anaerolineales bacterium]|nr:CRISPR-associated helicase Cas3' [Anaerolineales bacterium]
MDLYAHSSNLSGTRHTLGEHLRRVADLAKGFAGAFGYAEAAAVLGLLHDIGKAHPDFQAYLLAAESGARHAPRGPDHKMAGVLLALERGMGAAALALQGHHGGLQSAGALKAWLADNAARERATQALHQALEALPELAGIDDAVWPATVNDPLSAEVLVRFLFSSLVDADYLDTAAHFQPMPTPEQETLDVLWQRFEAHHALLGAPRSPVDVMRAQIYGHCLAAAEMPAGLFRLAVPTGGGKTLSGMGFALRHALLHGQERIVVAVPYISITEQTAQVYRDVFGEQVVLEHHSQAEELGEDPWMRLAAENWDAPIIVTTTVQLLESLFSNKPQRARKVHRLARSVIILDEVQSLPVHLLDATLDMLKRLTSDYGASIVLSTATQPAFDLIDTFRDPAIRDIVPEAERYYSRMRRVRYEPGRHTSWGDLAADLGQQRQALAIVNTKADAMALLDALEALGHHPLHLSTQLCGAHRRAVIAEMRRRLSAGEPCQLVSTQVVEAGVDIDFPVVYRAMGPLDAIVQAAGRCNREGHLREGRVVVFDLPEAHTAPGFYRTATGEARTVLAQGIDLNTLAGVRPYYELLYRDVDTDADNIQAYRREPNYPEVAARYRLIDDDSIAVVVPSYEREDWVMQCLESLARRQEDPVRLLRHLQPYIVNVYRRRADEYLRQGLLSEVVSGLYVWAGRYDAIRGMVPPSSDPSGFVI